MTSYSFTKQEKLKGKKEIDELFKSSNVFKNKLFRIVYNTNISDVSEVKILISIPKKNIKLAVKRNLIKRRVSESYRKNKLSLREFVTKSNISLHFAVIYLSSEILPYNIIEENVIDVIQRLESILKNKI